VPHPPTHEPLEPAERDAAGGLVAALARAPQAGGYLMIDLTLAPAAPAPPPPSGGIFDDSFDGSFE